MANICNGTLRIVAKNKDIFKRLEDIANERDNEYCLSRCFEFFPTEEGIQEEDDFFYVDYIVSGAWNCSRFFTDHCLHKKSTGANLTNLVVLAKEFDFGAELFAEECGFAFCEHCRVDHNGKYFEECGDFRIEYPKDKDGNDDLSTEGEYIYGLKDYMDFESVETIYG